jgi:hypothetical protein
MGPESSQRWSLKNTELMKLCIAPSGHIDYLCAAPETFEIIQDFHAVEEAFKLARVT